MQSSSGHYEHTKPPAPRSPDPEIAALTRLIADAERELSALKRKRKSINARARLAKLKASPEYKEMHAAAMRRAWQNPANAAAWAGGGAKRVLPPMTDAQRRKYKQLRWGKMWPREDALRLAGVSV